MRLFVSITGHGYGHVAQTAPVLAALRDRVPGLSLCVQTDVPRTYLETRISAPFEHLPGLEDFGLYMRDALHIDLERTAQAYAARHAHWDAVLDRQMRVLDAWQPDLVLANVGYVVLAAAARLGVPVLAMSSLNWAGIYGHYFGDRPEAPAVLAQMTAAYDSAQGFLCPLPSMPMPELSKVQPIGPIARIGRDRRAEICELIGASPQERLILVAFGGTPVRLPMEDWPQAPGVRWLVPIEWGIERPDCHPLEALGIGVTDVIRSCDAVLGKIGYGTVAECLCNGTPLLYVPRPEWPEEAALLAAMREHGRCAPVARESLQTGIDPEVLESLWAQPAPVPLEPTGALDAAERLVDAVFHR